jgi:hypothetical protein
MRGVSHLRSIADGKVNFHRDYWDTGEELYMKLPAIGTDAWLAALASMVAAFPFSARIPSRSGR